RRGEPRSKAMSTTHLHPTTTITIPTDSVACCCSREMIEERLRQHPHVRGVRFDWEHQVVEVQADEGTSTSELAELVACCCGGRNPVPLPPPQISSHAHAHTTSAPAVDHAAMGHTMPAEHGGMAHAHQDMSDPRMAAMEADMKRRFFISLILGIPTVLYSSLATNIFGLMLRPEFGALAMSASSI